MQLKDKDHAAVEARKLFSFISNTLGKFLWIKLQEYRDLNKVCLLHPDEVNFKAKCILTVNCFLTLYMQMCYIFFKNRKVHAIWCFIQYPKYIQLHIIHHHYRSIKDKKTMTKTDTKTEFFFIFFFFPAELLRFTCLTQILPAQRPALFPHSCLILLPKLLVWFLFLSTFRYRNAAH